MKHKELNQLKMSLSEAYDSSLFQGINSFEKERKELLETSLGLFESATIQSKVKDMETYLGSTSMANTFHNKEDYLTYTTPILNEIKNHDYEELKKILEVDTYTDYIKNDITQTLKSLNIVDTALNKIDENSEIDFKKYTLPLTEAFEGLASSENLFKSSQSLLSISEGINNDRFEDEMSKLNNKKTVQSLPPMHKLPNPPNYGKKIIESMDIQKKSLYMIQNHMEEQNKISQEQINLSKLSSNKQIKVLDEQIHQNKVSFEQQNKDTKKIMNITIFIAFVSIFIAIWTSISSINKANEIYNKENKSSNQQHQELLIHLKSFKNENVSRKEVEILQKILTTMEKNNKVLTE